MGTDIHGVFQRQDKEPGQWHDVPSNYAEDRHYQLFAVLAGVRNGRGFAGIPTGDSVEPIAYPRGLPDDFMVANVEDADGNARHPMLRPDGEKAYKWMGDHTYSWLTGEEMLAWEANAPVVMKIGILDRAVYEAWDGASPPSDYCGDISGSAIVKIRDSEIERASVPNWTHIHCSWRSPLRVELAYFFDEVARLALEHGNVRFVFGFDS